MKSENEVLDKFGKGYDMIDAALIVYRKIKPRT